MSATTRPAATLQGFYDHVAGHLRRMPHRALGHHGDPAYIGTDGLACPFGDLVLRHDPRHWVLIDGAGSLVPHVAAEAPELAGHVWPDSPEGLELADQLQELHDGATFWGDHGLSPRGEDQLRHIALAFGLTYTTPARTR